MKQTSFEEFGHDLAKRGTFVPVVAAMIRQWRTC